MQIQDDVLVDTTRSLIMLDQSGDTTLTWESDKDDEMEALIQKKMNAGVSFYIVATRKPGQRGAVAKPKLLKNADEARKHRALSIPDADFSKFVLDGFGEAVASAPRSEPVQTVRRAKTAKEVASNHTVGVQARRGG